jgi:hypothetical protein
LHALRCAESGGAGGARNSSLRICVKFGIFTEYDLAANQSFLGGGFNVQGKYHVFSETVLFAPGVLVLSQTLPSVSTLRSAIELKAVFDQVQQVEQSGKPQSGREETPRVAGRGKGSPSPVQIIIFSPRASAAASPPLN